MTDQNNEMREIEAIEKDIEPLPEAGGLLSATKSSTEDMFWLADNIEKIIQSQNKIRLGILKLAQPGDWIIFGNETTKKAEIGFAGANRIGSTLGISFKNWNAEKIKDSDEKGEYYRWEFTCDAMFRNSEVRVYGRASSRDKFFGKAYGELKPLHDIKEDDIKVAAMRAAKKEGVRDLLGLHHMDPDFLSKNGVVLASAGGHTFKGREEQASETTVVNIAIEEVTQKNGNTNGKSWIKYTVKDIEGSVYSTFSESIAKEASKFKGTNQPIKVEFVRDGNYLNLVSINDVKGGQK